MPRSLQSLSTVTIAMIFGLRHTQAHSHTRRLVVIEGIVSGQST